MTSMLSDIPISLLAAVFLSLAMMLIIMRSVRMPKEHYKNQKRRDELRLLLLKKRILPPPKEEENPDGKKAAEDASVKSTE